MSVETFLDGRVSLYAGDCMRVLAELPPDSVDSCVTDPPYALVSIGKRFGSDNAAPCKPGKTGAYARASAGFMGKKWDTGETAFSVGFWREVLRVLKPGAHVVAFGGTRTYHRLACAIEDAGFEIRDQIGWCFGTGFPKSHDVSAGIDRAAGAGWEVVARNPNWRGRVHSDSVYSGGQSRSKNITSPASAEALKWQGWGTALKPAWEPIVLARKPLIGTVAANVLAHGTGALNIDGCRIPTTDAIHIPSTRGGLGGTSEGWDRPWKNDADAMAARLERAKDAVGRAETLGRWPANIVHDGSPEVLAAFPDASGQQRPVTGDQRAKRTVSAYGDFGATEGGMAPRNDFGSAARFFYSSKADADDRLGSKHPTVKPVDLMQWLVRLVTPPGGIVLDPFAGTGTTGEAAIREGMRAILIEREPEYQADIRRRMALVMAGPDERARESLKASGKAEHSAGPLFDGQPPPTPDRQSERLRQIRPRRSIGPVGMTKW